MRAPTKRPAASAAKPLVITRVFDAPRSLVFRAWTEAEHLVKWWGQPKGATLPYYKFDCRVGGMLHFRVLLPDGNVVWGKGIFREIVAPERIVLLDYFSDEQGNIVEPPPGLPKESVITATFAERGDKTVVTVEHRGTELASKENQEAYQQGWGESLDRLAEDLAQAPRRELVITRVFDAPRERVWQAWTDPKHLAQWWGPEGFTNPVCEVDVRPGGAIHIVMRAPDGADHPMRGVFREIVKPERLVFTAFPVDRDGNPLLEQHTVISFADRGGKTELTVKASAVAVAPIAAQFLKGMDTGWAQSIDKLERLLAKR
jgi:uncharacterized protein YndB with AHSA1/START domain